MTGGGFVKTLIVGAGTFFNVSGEKYAGLLENIKKHFLSRS
jgi:hypothetical protein